MGGFRLATGPFMALMPIGIGGHPFMDTGDRVGIFGREGIPTEGIAEVEATAAED